MEGRGPGFDEGDQAVNGIAPFQQVRDPGDLRAGQHAFHDGSQEMERLAAQKVHGTHRFEKQCGRRRHAARDDGISSPFEQGQVVGGEGGFFRTHGKRVPETGSQILCATG